MSSTPTKPDPGDVRAGYQLVGQLIAYEGQLVWSQTGVFVLVLAALLAGAFLEKLPGVTSKELTAFLQLVSALFALVSSLVWWSMALRSRKYYNYWVAQGRELEQHMPGIAILTEGRRLGMRKEIVVGGDHMKLSSLATFTHSTLMHYTYALVTTICTFVVLSRLSTFIRIL